MAQEKVKKDKSNDNSIDKVGETNVYPVSEMEGASDDAKIQSEGSFGQGKRGAEGYEDSGTSEIIPDSEFENAGKNKGKK